MDLPKDIKSGRLFVLSAPSGSGKSTLKDLALQRLPELVYSVSYTTRRPRPGEIDGRDYNFISEERFQAMVDGRDFLEWAGLFGRHYGTGRAWVLERLRQGRDVLADLDVTGAASVRRLMPGATLIFMAPPTVGELRRRLSSRRTESAEEAGRRLTQAREEIARRRIYDYLLINDRLDDSLEQLVAIIKFGRGRPMAEMENFWPAFFADQDQPR
ncbi:MAG: guanylate kinase [Candidatus Adiutrix sp.]|jgi:guanylate kinase|nr:guanylate kinase [Candidatus Adiutrix sp.]